MSTADTRATSLDLDLALSIHAVMARIRAFELRVSEIFATGELPGFVHLSIGQEAVAAGVGAALRPDDHLATNHRGHGHIIAKGAALGPMMAELMGRVDGYCRGKGGSMHIFSARHGVLGANGILGAGLPIATGAALSAQMRGTDQVTVAFFGEGASAQGAVHEAMNLAAVWQLPVVFIAEVNGFAELTPFGVHCPVSSLTERASGYAMPGVEVDGGDALQVHAATAAAVERARAGGGPSLVQATTDRWHGHYEGDPQRYRDPSHLADARARDALLRLAAVIVDAAPALRTEIELVVAAAEVEVDNAVAFGRASALPLGTDALLDVYS